MAARLTVLAVLLLAACASKRIVSETTRPTVATVERIAVEPVAPDLRRAFELAPFYERHVDLNGFPVVGSAKVTDYALLEAAYVIESMLAKRPDILAALVERRVRCCVMAYSELTTDVPEHSDLAPKQFWDRRARGLGASPERPCVSCAEENMLGYPGDPYPTENILVHEFAHAIDLMALRHLDPTFEARLERCYTAAMAAGKWKNLYAAENKEEYWAEGVQSWFDTNRPPDALHNDVDTRAELETYDPALAALIEEALGDNPWRYQKPSDREAALHLVGFEPGAAPRFAWPQALNDWYRKYEHEARTGAGRVDLSAQSPSTAAKMKSRGTTAKSSILFINRTSALLRIFWVDFEGGRKPYGQVNAGKTAEFPTYDGHVWMVADADGNDVAAFVVTPSPGRATIEAR